MAQILAKTQEEILSSIMKSLEILLKMHKNDLPPEAQSLSKKIISQLQSFETIKSEQLDVDALKSNLISLAKISGTPPLSDSTLKDTQLKVNEKNAVTGNSPASSNDDYANYLKGKVNQLPNEPKNKDIIKNDVVLASFKNNDAVGIVEPKRKEEISQNIGIGVKNNNSDAGTIEPKNAKSILDNTNNIIDKHLGDKGLNTNGISRLVYLYSQQILIGLAYGAAQDAISDGISYLTNSSKKNIVTPKEDDYVFTDAQMQNYKMLATDLDIKPRDYINALKIHNINLMQRWTIAFNDDKWFYPEIWLLAFYYATEVDIPFPKISIGTINYGRYIKDISGMQNQPLTVTFLLDSELKILNQFNAIVAAMGDPNMGIVGYKDEYKIKEIEIAIENNVNEKMVIYTFRDLVISDMITVNVRQENSEAQLVTVTFDYDYKNVKIINRPAYDNLPNTSTGDIRNEAENEMPQFIVSSDNELLQS